MNSLNSSSLRMQHDATNGSRFGYEQDSSGTRSVHPSLPPPIPTSTPPTQEIVNLARPATYGETYYNYSNHEHHLTMDKSFW